MIFDPIAAVISVISVILQILVLFTALWIILRAQKVDYSRAGLFGTVIVATGLDYIPYYGHFAAFGVILWILEKMTHAEWTHMILTTAIGYGIKFCFTFWLLGLLLGGLHSSFESLTNAMAERESTNQVSTAMSSGAAETPEPTNSTPDRTRPPVKSGYPTNMVPLELLPITITYFSMNGIIPATHPAAVINTGVRTYNICVADSTIMQTINGRVITRCDRFTNNSVMLNISGIPVTLTLSTNTPASSNPK